MLTQQTTDALINNFILPQISQRTTIEALTIIANALVLNPALLSSFDPLPVFSLVLNNYAKSNLSPKENYLLGRLLFLFTFNGCHLSDSLLSSCIDTIDSKTSLVLENVHALTSVISLNPLIRLSFIELMKFVFNLIHHYPDRATAPLQEKVMTKLSYIFLAIRTSDVRNLDITRYLLNTLMCVSITSWFDNPVHMPLLLTNMLDYCHLVASPANTNLHNEQTLSPAFTCLQQMLSVIWDTLEDAELADQLKSIARHALYPTEKDRELALGNSDSMASSFMKLSTDITVQACNRIVQDVYWIAFDRCQHTLNEVMGFGFASSFLASTSFMDGGDSLMEPPRTRKSSVVSCSGITNDDDLFSNLPSSRRNSAASDVSTPGPAINPITGQYLHIENKDDRRLQAVQEWEAMTEEEKEIESDRMFTLFERLKQNSVIKMSSPMEMPTTTTST